jgi:hypothetical protein
LPFGEGLSLEVLSPWTREPYQSKSSGYFPEVNAIAPSIDLRNEYSPFFGIPDTFLETLWRGLAPVVGDAKKLTSLVLSSHAVPLLLARRSLYYCTGTISSPGVRQ